MASLLELNTLVNAYCPNVPSIVVSGALRECARDYFTQVNAHIVDLPVDTVQSDPLVALAVDPELEIVAVIGVRHSHYDVLQGVTDFPKIEQTGKPDSYTTENRQSIHLLPTPDNVYSLTVSVAVRPSRKASTIDDTVLNENLSGLRYGTLARLKAQPQTDWFSPNEVPFYDNKFQQEISSRRIQLSRKEIQAELRVKIPSF